MKGQQQEDHQHKLQPDKKKESSSTPAIATTTSSSNAASKPSKEEETTKKEKREKKHTSSTSHTHLADKKSSSKHHYNEKGKDREAVEASTDKVMHNATLHDLCRAAEELERIENIERNGLRRDVERSTPKKHRPGDISIPSHSSPLILPHDRKLANFSPPYTPPPILSPARSITLIGGPAPITPSGVPCTPNKIWQRKGKHDHYLTIGELLTVTASSITGSDRISESEESFSYAEP